MSGDSEINSSLNVGEVRDRADVSGVRVDQARDVYVTAGEGRSALWVNVPGLRGHFLGRETLVQELVERLTAGESVSLAAHGLPGVGKSTLASRVAHRRDVLDHFKDGVLWAELGPQGDAARLLGQWALALGEDMSGLVEIEERRQAVQRLIGQRRLLLVIDDAWDEEAAQLLRCGGPGCAHLLTTRRQDLAQEFTRGENAIFVPPLEPEPAVRLLRELAPEAWEANRAAVRELARRTGRLPLALELVGGYLGKPESSLWPDLAQEALAEMADPKRRLQLAARRLGKVGDKKETLQETIALSVDSLPEEAQRAFFALGAFAPRPATFTRTAAEAVTEAGARTLVLLVARNLLEMTEDGSLALHQTLADFAQGQTPEAAVVRHRDHHLALAQADPEDWQRIEVAYGQIGRAWERAPEDERLLDLIEAMRTFQSRRGLRQDQMAWIRRGLDVARAAGLRAEEGNLLNNLGWVHQSIGQRERALATYERALAIQEEVGNRPGLGTTLNNIASIYYSLKQYKEALATYERVLAILEGVEDQPELETTLNNIGLVYRGLGKDEEALDYYERALAIQEEGEDRLQRWTTLNNIGGVYQSQRRYEEALKSYKRALAICKELGDRAGMGTTLNNIGLVDNYLGRYEEALDYYEQALAIKEEVEDRAGMAVTLNNIGAVYQKLGRHEEALDHHEQAAAILEEVGDWSQERITRYNLVLIYREEGRLREAVAEQRRVVEIRGGMQHPDFEDDRAVLAALEAELAGGTAE